MASSKAARVGEESVSDLVEQWDAAYNRQSVEVSDDLWPYL